MGFLGSALKVVTGNVGKTTLKTAGIIAGGAIAVAVVNKIGLGEISETLGDGIADSTVNKVAGELGGVGNVLSVATKILSLF